mmetsp:Transcript_69159/g.179776  ORF Transcript_69159/g.179776 Transcript_69159/m.179776 type:complete len:592 (-) Transcript_69159:408-2183(-)
MAVSGTLTHPPGDAWPESVRNVLFITADQMRGDCMSCAGHPVVETPHLDALAKRGIRFAQHFTPAAPCAPARACLHTGMYMANHRVITNGVPLSSEFTNWAQEILEQGSIEPCMIGYPDVNLDPRPLAKQDPKLQRWDGGHLPGIKNLSEGSLMGSPAWLREHGVAEALGAQVMAEIEKPGFVSWNGWQGDAHWLATPKGVHGLQDAPLHADGYPAPASYKKEASDTYVLTSQAMDFVREEVVAKRPWALHLSLLKPHPPFLAPEPYNAKFHPARVDLPAPGRRAESVEAEAAVHPFLKAEHANGTSRPLLQNDTGSVAEVTDAELRELRSAYYGLISEVDDNLGRLMATLAELGEDRQTLIIFTSDHGELLGEHRLRGKIGFHDGAFHVPLLVCDPRPSAAGACGTTVTAFTQHVDIAPTILDYLGLRVPRQIDGKTLRCFAEQQTGEPADWRSCALWEYDFRHRSSGEALRRDWGLDMDECSILVLRTKTRKLVHFGGSLPQLLFDLEKDPGELVDVSNDVKYAPDFRQLVSQLLSWRVKHANRSLTHLRIGTGGSLLRFDDTSGQGVEASGEDPKMLAHRPKKPRVAS